MAVAAGILIFAGVVASHAFLWWSCHREGGSPPDIASVLATARPSLHSITSPARATPTMLNPSNDLDLMHGGVFWNLTPAVEAKIEGLKILEHQFWGNAPG